MRNVKVNVQADTTQALGKVRELTGALAQLDAVTKRNVQYLLQTLSGAGLNPQVVGSVGAQQKATAQAQEQANRAASNNSQTTQPGSKNKDFTKANEAMMSMAEKQFELFSQSLANALSEAFKNLFIGKFKSALTGLRDSLRGLFGELLGQLVGEIAGVIRQAILKQLKSLKPARKDTGADVALPIPPTPVGITSPVGDDAAGGEPGVSGGTGSQAGITPGTGAAGATRPRIVFPTGNQAGMPGSEQDLQPSQILLNTVGTAIRPRRVEVPKTPDPTRDITKFSWGNLGKLLGSMAPALGSSLGGLLGGPSAVGSILGSIGGLAGGTAIGLLTGAIGPGLGGSISILGTTIGVGLASGLLAGVGVALMIGAYIIGKNKQRRADEKARNQAMLDSLGQLDEILKQINRDEMEGSAGVSQANNIRKQYVEQMSQLKDKKTRNIALKDVSRLDAKIVLIKQAADNQSARKAMDAKLVPTFAEGGLVGAPAGGYKVLGSDGVFMQPFRGRVPGIYDRRDDFLARLSGNEVVLTPDVWMPISPYLKQKRVPGFAAGGIAGDGFGSGFAGTSKAQSNQEVIIEELIIHLNNQFGADTAAKIVDVGLKSPGGQQAVVRSVRTHIGENGLGDGLVRDINTVNERGF